MRVERFMLTAKKRLVVVSMLTILAVIAIYVFGVIGWDGLSTRRGRTLWRERSCSLIKVIGPEFSKENVVKIAQEHGFSKNWMIHRRASEIRIYTPLEFGACNWVIRLKFMDNKLTHVMVRTEDDLDF